LHDQGAENRARRAKDEDADCDLYFGVEGGIETEKNGKLVCFAWVIVFDKVLSVLMSFCVCLQ
jgi:non-canonical (house-cleaning) NTP pyrophosphatase